MNIGGAGDHRVLCESAYREHAVGLRGFVTTIILDRDLAEDVVHEAFLELWQHPDRWDPARADLLSWLRTIARRRAIDRIRSTEAAQRRDLRIGARDHERLDQNLEGRDVVFLRPRLRVALSALTDKQREAVLLRYLGEHTAPEVARQLNVSVATAKTRVRDGLLALQRILTDTRYSG